MILDQQWFEMRDIRKRRYNDAVWIPLYATAESASGKYGQIGYQTDFFRSTGLAIYIRERNKADEFGLSELGSSSHGVEATRTRYKTADVYEYRPKKPLGIALVLRQSFDGTEPDVWHLNQDLVFALGLLREGDSWVCPDEGYEEVVRLKRDVSGKQQSIEIRSEFLRDYLCARRMAFRLTTFRQRGEIAIDSSHIAWASIGLIEDGTDERFEGRVQAVHPGGMPFESKISVVHIRRTDVDPYIDVPTFGLGDNEIEGSARTYKRTGQKFNYIIGELNLNAWIEPAAKSSRVRSDRIPSEVSFIVDAVGTRLSSDKISKAPNRYLWFRASVIPELLSRRGGELCWYTHDTGCIRLPPSTDVHFGINPSGLVTVFAKDIVELREWQRRIWAGFNVSPEGGVCAELLASQQRAEPADTVAPESVFSHSLEELDEAFKSRFGSPVIVQHRAAQEISETVHRFRALDNSGLLALAKDLARLTVDSFDIALLQKIVPPAAGEKKPGSLKSMQAVLTNFVSPDEAKRVLTKLVGIYELRLGDAHLPSSKIEEAFTMVGLDRAVLPIQQGCELLAAAAEALLGIASIVRQERR